MKITFIIANTWETYCAREYENEFKPYKKRSVTITLTEEQIKNIKLRQVGKRAGKSVYEEYIDCFIEKEESHV